MTRLRRCETCRHSDTEGETALTCRRAPPSLTFVLVPMQTVMQQGMGINGFSGWPEVKPEQWCGEWASRLEKMQ